MNVHCARLRFSPAVSALCSIHPEALLQVHCNPPLDKQYGSWMNVVYLPLYIACSVQRSVSEYMCSVAFIYTPE